jgi:phage gpG-like protein
MLAASLDGFDTLAARFEALPAALQAVVRAKAADLAERLRTHVLDDKLSGQVLRSKTGALAASIGSEVSVDGDRITARVFSAGDVKYARIQEYGGRTAAHQIVPMKSRVLAFIAGGGTVFAMRVQHPGSTLPERSYLRSSLADMAGQIASELKRAVVDAIQDQIGDDG